MSKLLELAERCEASAGPDRELDAAISETVLGWKKGTIGQAGTCWRDDRGGIHMPPEFTASLDAAMTLASKGQTAMVLQQAIAACLAATHHRADAFTLRLPAFVSAAALRARASIEGGEK